MTQGFVSSRNKTGSASRFRAAGAVFRLEVPAYFDGTAGTTGAVSAPPGLAAGLPAGGAAAG